MREAAGRDCSKEAMFELPQRHLGIPERPAALHYPALLPPSLPLPFRGRCPARARTFCFPFHPSPTWNRFCPRKTNCILSCLCPWPPRAPPFSFKASSVFPLRVITGFNSDESSVFTLTHTSLSWYFSFLSSFLCNSLVGFQSLQSGCPLVYQCLEGQGLRSWTGRF